ncbi:ribose pyranase [Cryobacterium roopkundense]|uniref:D-ribose pyranase n=1 Tax=Cryobacterium roopkundense TaxID=1001240 RepID=A0A099JU27_9MICO|nr:D-ribose pyranase [Cryobacterium roopkundense]KGJ81127.1 ribose pyranase [Cryobacterium roopkundense]MBB5641873.1 D-ribose pyranase [Cryobacterium roopkundense]
MRRNGATLNGQLSRIISETGHTDLIVVSDAGLPIPKNVERVDLAYRPGAPGFLDVLDTVLGELVVERVTLASEIAETSPAVLAELHGRFDPLGIPIELMPHVDFKRLSLGARAAVRSGEFTPYANVILHAGVAY